MNSMRQSHFVSCAVVVFTSIEFPQILFETIDLKCHTTTERITENVHRQNPENVQVHLNETKETVASMQLQTLIISNTTRN